MKYGLADDLGAVYEVPFGPEKFDAFVNYLFAQNEDPTNLTPITNHLGRKAREQFMSIAEKLRTEGRTEGRVEGLTEGLAMALTTQLTRIFGPLPAETQHTIQSADPDQLQTWLIRVVGAKTLQDVFH